MNTQHGKIGIFDSGFGGLTIMKSIVEALPEYDYLYLGDTARTPYGTRSSDVVYEFTKQATDYLFNEGCSLIILACNTASSDALARLQKDYESEPHKKVLGVIIPTVEHDALYTDTKPIGILATEGTVNSGAFVREIKKVDSAQKVVQSPAPLLVPLIENGETDTPMLDLALAQYLAPLLQKKIGSLILGCTHYSIIADALTKHLPQDVVIIQEGPVVAAKLADYLTRHKNIKKSLSTHSTREFLTTDRTNRFANLGSTFYGTTITPQNITLT